MMISVGGERRTSKEAPRRRGAAPARLLEHAHRIADRLGGAVERRALLVVQLDLEHLLEAVAAQLARHTQEEPLIPYSPSSQAEHGRIRFLSFTIASAICTARRRRRVVGGARLQVLHDLRAAVPRAIHDRVQRLLIAISCVIGMPDTVV
jgi:hypothetical protein